MLKSRSYRWEVLAQLCFDPQNEQQVKNQGERIEPTVDCHRVIRRGLVAVYIEKMRSAECT